MAAMKPKYALIAMLGLLLSGCAEKGENVCYAKLVCARGDSPETQKVWAAR